MAGADLDPEEPAKALSDQASALHELNRAKSFLHALQGFSYSINDEADCGAVAELTEQAMESLSAAVALVEDLFSNMIMVR